MQFPLCLVSDIKPTVKSFVLRFQPSGSKPQVGGGGGVLQEFLGGGVPLRPWNP